MNKNKNKTEEMTDDSEVRELRHFIQINSEQGVAAGIEAKRIAEKYGKEFLDCDDLVEIMGVGRNNIRQLMRSVDFPVKQIGNRKVISVIGFAFWAIQTGDM